MKLDNYIVYTPRVRDLAAEIQREFNRHTGRPLKRPDAIDLALDRIMKPRPLPESGWVHDRNGAATWRISTESNP